MKILIDFTQIGIQKAGIGVYGINLIAAIYKIGKENHYYILMQNDDNSLDFVNDSSFHIIKTEIHRTSKKI